MGRPCIVHGHCLWPLCKDEQPHIYRPLSFLHQQGRSVVEVLVVVVPVVAVMVVVVELLQVLLPQQPLQFLQVLAVGAEAGEDERLGE